MVPHFVKLLSFIDDKYVQLPFNFMTLQQLVTPAKSEGLLAKMRYFFQGKDRIPIFDLIEHTDADISDYGKLLFNKAYKTYTVKQWGLAPEKIDRSVINRVQMCLGYDDRFLNKDFQYLPKDGFTKLFERMLDHPNITVKLNCDALNLLKPDDNLNKVIYDSAEYEQIIFTGAVDELFLYEYGKLPYRSLEFVYEYHKTESFLPCEIVSYPQAEGYTRRTEYRKFNYIPVDTPYTVVATEYPMEYDKDAAKGNLPYYPIINSENMELYKKYTTKAEKYKNLLLCGRLAEYKYFNMDAVIENAVDKFEKLKTKLNL
jgi:UDP-galactopyranose mutase